MIYADHAATTALSPTAYDAMQPWLKDKCGNPSTLYSLAREPRKAISAARETIAAVIGALPEEIVFTSGGTESDNWALVGTAFRFPNVRKHLITSSIEHHAILNTCAFLSRMGHDISYLSVSPEGIVSLDALRDSFQTNTVLTSIMLANNEIGTIEPIHELADAAHEHGSLFHTDAVQAVGHIPIDVSTLGVDFLSASAHKFNGPKGIGFLYIRKGVNIEPFHHGGSQEAGRRAGTENTAGIVGMATALDEHQKHLQEEARYLQELSADLISELKALSLDFIINGSVHRVPGNISLSFRYVEGELLMHRLDLMGTAVATGSACNSKNTVLSHVIEAIGVPDEYSHGTIRITLGMDNTKEQMHTIAHQIQRVLQ